MIEIHKESSSSFFLPKVSLQRIGRVKGKTLSKQVVIRDQHISYDTCLKDRRRVLNTVGVPGEDYAEHSDRGGGITKLVNSGAPLEDAQTHGRWNSLAVAHRYVQKSEEKKRALSRWFFKT